MKKYKRIFRHSLLMVRKNLKSYLLVSISILISFVIILSFLLINDSLVYNHTKNVYKNPSNLFQVSKSHADNTNLKYFLNAIMKLSKTETHHWKMNSARLTAYSNPKNIVSVNLYFMTHAHQTVPYYDGSFFREIKITEGRYFTPQEIENKHRVIVVGQSFAQKYLGNVLNQVIKLENVSDVGGILRDYRVIGIYDDTQSATENYDEIGDVKSFSTHFILPITTSDDFDNQYEQSFTVIISDHKQDVTNLAWNLGINVVSSGSQIASAHLQKFNNAVTKGMVLLIVFVILGINAYASSSFSIQRRRREIGIKLALGIEKKDIFIEFFVESAMVMMLNIVLSFAVVFTVAIVVLLFTRVFVDPTAILYISGSSLLQFIVFSVFLITITCLVLANQAMRTSPLEQMREV